MGKKNKLGNQELQAWIGARRRHRLSHTQVQMARELGMNPKKLGKLDNHDQEPWKLPLRQFIEHLYFKHFGRERPEVVLSLEAMVRREKAQKVQRRKAKTHAPQAGGASKAAEATIAAVGNETGVDTEPGLGNERGLDNKPGEHIGAADPGEAGK